MQKACDLGDCQARDRHPECREDAQKALEDAVDGWLNDSGSGKPK